MTDKIKKCEFWQDNEHVSCSCLSVKNDRFKPPIVSSYDCTKNPNCHYKQLLQSQHDLKVAREALEKSKRIIKSILDKSCYGKDKCKTDKCTSYSIFCSFYHLAQDLKELEQALAQLNGGNNEKE